MAKVKKRMLAHFMENLPAQESQDDPFLKNVVCYIKGYP